MNIYTYMPCDGCNGSCHMLVTCCFRLSVSVTLKLRPHWQTMIHALGPLNGLATEFEWTAGRWMHYLVTCVIYIYAVFTVYKTVSFICQVVVTTGAIKRSKLQWNCHHQQTNTQFFTGRMPFLSPNQQCQSTEGMSITGQKWPPGLY